MKKRILSFVLVLCLLLGIFPAAALAADGTALTVEFNKVPINQAYMNSARITGALVTEATRLEAAPEAGEDGRVHIQVELSQATQDGDTVHVEMNVSNASNSGIGCGLKPEIIPGGLDVYNSGHVTNYDVTIENGAGQLMCYSYYNGTQYTTLVMDFVVGDSGSAWVTPHDWMANDSILSQIYVWNQPVLKCMFQDAGSAEAIPNTAGPAHALVGYLWLEESVPDDAVVGLELRRGYSNLLDKPEGWSDLGGYVQLENGEATVTFNLQGLGGYLVGHNCRVTLYIKNHLSHAPEADQADVTYNAEVDVPYTIDFRELFTDRDADTLTYTVSVNGGEAESSQSYKYRFVPSEAGTTVLNITASDGYDVTETCTVSVVATADHVWGEWTVLQEATCLEAGTHTHTCLCCGTKETETITAKGEHTWGEWVVTKNANCKDDGKQVRTCTACGAMENGVIAAGEHDWVTTSTATCGQAGVQTATCTGCGETKTTQVPATGEHTWSAWQQTNAPTCVNPGTETRTCTVCNHSEEREVAATGKHTMGTWRQTVAPSCVDGLRERNCTQCGLAETMTIAANGQHAWGDWVTEIVATPSKSGTEKRVCNHCHETESRTVYYRQPCAYVNLCVSGEMKLTRAEVPLEDCNSQDGVTVDDVLIMTHSMYAPADKGYSSNGEFVGMLWGDTSGAFGYLKNNDFCWSLEEVVEDGDEIYAYVYSDKAMWTDQFSYFDKEEVSVKAGQTFTLHATRVYYDTILGYQYVDLADAVITVDGESTMFRTDSSGNVDITLETGGTHVISAVNKAYILVPAVCVVNVDANQTALNPPVLTEADATATTITVTPPEASFEDPDAVVEYSISANGKYWEPWQQSNVFANLSSDTDYQVRARYVTAMPEKYLDSAASQILKVRTAGAPATVFTFGDAAGEAGQTVQIPVSLLCEAPGVWKWNCALDYDTDRFALIGIEPGADATGWTVKVNRVTRCVYGYLPEGESVDQINGEMFVLTLKVKETAPAGEYAIGISDIWNTASKNAFWDADGVYIKVVGEEREGTVTVSGDAAVPSEPAGYRDVTAGTWYYEPVQFVTREGLMQGTGASAFSPDSATSRAMLVTVLYRLEGSPDATVNHPFQDVNDGSYYADAVAWAYENGIVNGIAADRFAPEAIISRQQVATILYRYAQYRNADVSATIAMDGFADTADVDGYACRAMQWAVADGLITGVGNDRLDPDGSATRAQLAAILSRYLSE